MYPTSWIFPIKQTLYPCETTVTDKIGLYNWFNAMLPESDYLCLNDFIFWEPKSVTVEYDGQKLIRKLIQESYGIYGLIESIIEGTAVHVVYEYWNNRSIITFDGKEYSITSYVADIPKQNISLGEPSCIVD